VICKLIDCFLFFLVIKKNIKIARSLLTTRHPLRLRALARNFLRLRDDRAEYLAPRAAGATLVLPAEADADDLTALVVREVERVRRAARDFVAVAEVLDSRESCGADGVDDDRAVVALGLGAVVGALDLEIEDDLPDRAGLKRGGHHLRHFSVVGAGFVADREPHASAVGVCHGRPHEVALHKRPYDGLRLLQFWNAELPMVLTEEGRVMLIRLVQPKNALSAMAVTGQL